MQEIQLTGVPAGHSIEATNMALEVIRGDFSEGQTYEVNQDVRFVWTDKECTVKKGQVATDLILDAFNA